MDRLWVKTGTQIIDNVWRQMKVKGVPKELNVIPDKIDEYVRGFQWRHWHAEDDKWAAMGAALVSLRSEA